MLPVKSLYSTATSTPRHRYYRLGATGTTGDVGINCYDPPQALYLKEEPILPLGGPVLPAVRDSARSECHWPCIPCPLGLAYK